MVRVSIHKWACVRYLAYIAGYYVRECHCSNAIGCDDSRLSWKREGGPLTLVEDDGLLYGVYDAKDYQSLHILVPRLPESICADMYSVQTWL